MKVCVKVWVLVWVLVQWEKLLRKAEGILRCQDEDSWILSAERKWVRMETRSFLLAEGIKNWLTKDHMPKFNGKVQLNISIWKRPLRHTKSRKPTILWIFSTRHSFYYSWWNWQTKFFFVIYDDNFFLAKWMWQHIIVYCIELENYLSLDSNLVSNLSGIKFTKQSSWWKTVFYI